MKPHAEAFSDKTTYEPAYADAALIASILENYQLPSHLGFGASLAPIMYCAEYRNGSWHEGGILPFDQLRISPAATCLQFGQQCFEGLKAYQVNQAHPQLFRPELNYARFCRSAKRLCMPPPPAEIFAHGLMRIVTEFSQHIPNFTGQSLYLRPTLLGTSATFQVTPSHQYKFIIIASPSEAYFNKPIKVMIERSQTRAVRGGTGTEKVGGNYAASLHATAKSIAKGYDQPLWLDALEQRYIEELSGMNVMAVIEGELHTPALTGSILPGITRATLLELARHWGITIKEKTIAIDALTAAIQQGQCSELFACGTAAIVSPIAEIGEADGRRYPLAEVNTLAAKFKTGLLDIQEGRAQDIHQWMVNAHELEALCIRFRDFQPTIVEP